MIRTFFCFVIYPSEVFGLFFYKNKKVSVIIQASVYPFAGGRSASGIVHKLTGWFGFQDNKLPENGEKERNSDKGCRPSRVPARGPGGRDIKLEQHLACVLTATAGVVQKGHKSKGHNAVERTALTVWCGWVAPLPGAQQSSAADYAGRTHDELHVMRITCGLGNTRGSRGVCGKQKA